MKKIILSAIGCVFYGLCVSAQSIDVTKLIEKTGDGETTERTEMSKGDDEKVYDNVDEIPQFPGGPSALFEYLSNKIKYPIEAKIKGIQGRVIVTFVVERDGSIGDIKVMKSADPLLDREALRVVKAMPNWVPGKKNGSAVRVKSTIPVTFKSQ